MNKEEVAIKVAHWLSSRRHTRAVHPVIVQIGRRLYPAARYTEANKRAWQDKICLIGEMPPLQNRLDVPAIGPTRPMMAGVFWLGFD